MEIKKGQTIPVLDKGFVRLIDWMGNDERICEAARISYRAPSKGAEQDKKLLSYLYRNRHTSPFEQCSITFNIKLPLFIQAQMVRHRTQRLNQVSARYTEMKDEFYIPKTWRQQDTKNKQGSKIADKTFTLVNRYGTGCCPSIKLEEHCKQSYQLYQDMIKLGVAREMARMVLPQNLYTEIYSNWDIRNLCHFFDLRLDDKHAQHEIVEYAKAMFDIFKQLYPWTAEAWDKYKFVVKEINDV